MYILHPVCRPKWRLIFSIISRYITRYPVYNFADRYVNRYSIFKTLPKSQFKQWYFQNSTAFRFKVFYGLKVPIQNILRISKALYKAKKPNSIQLLLLLLLLQQQQQQQCHLSPSMESGAWILFLHPTTTNKIHTHHQRSREPISTWEDLRWKVTVCKN